MATIHSSTTRSRRRWLFLGLGVTALMLVLAGFDFMPVIVLLGLIYLLLRYGTRPLALSIARLGYSIRWKFEIAIAVVAALFLFSSLVTFGSMDFMHDGLHDIQELGPSRPDEVLRAVDNLNDTQHGFLFSMTPLMGLLGLLIAAVLGAAMAWTVIDPVRRIGQAMRRIAAGDFSQRVEVENNDELGELANQVNHAAAELTSLQEATLAAERARAQQERVVQVSRAEAEERRRISRELHDGLGPSLAAIGNRLRVSRSMVRTDPEAAETGLDEVTESLKGHVQEIRELVYGLRPLALEQLGFSGALKQNMEQFSRDTGIQASTSISEGVALNPHAEVTVFRILQEFLSNVQKHAAATQVDIRLQVMDTGLEIRVRDNGRGFDPRHVASNTDDKGLGLVSMKERAELLGGSLSVQSSPGNGCQVVLYIPSSEVEIGANSNTPGG